MTQNQIAYQANLIKQREADIKKQEADTHKYSADTERFEAGRRSDLIDAQISQIIHEYGDIVSKDYKHDPYGVSELDKVASTTLGKTSPLKGLYTVPYRQQQIDTQREGNILNFLGGLFGSGAKVGSSFVGRKK